MASLSFFFSELLLFPYGSLLLVPVESASTGFASVWELGYRRGLAGGLLRPRWPLSVPGHRPGVQAAVLFRPVPGRLARDRHGQRAGPPRERPGREQRLAVAVAAGKAGMAAGPSLQPSLPLVAGRRRLLPELCEAEDQRTSLALHQLGSRQRLDGPRELGTTLLQDCRVTGAPVPHTLRDSARRLRLRARIWRPSCQRARTPSSACQDTRGPWCSFKSSSPRL